MSSYIRGQPAVVTAPMLHKQTGNAITSGVDVYITKAGVQTLATNTPVYNGNYQWQITLTAAEMNAANLAVLFVGTDATPHNVNIATTEETSVDISEDEIDIAGLANSPKRTRTEEGTVEERTIDELIKADQYIKGQEGATAVPWGIRIARTKPGSSIGGGSV